MSEPKVNPTIVQFFEWYLPNDGKHWKRCAELAESLPELGVTGVWLPPAFKGAKQDDVGYGVYDTYDLGEFAQKGTVRTKYGTKDEYIAAIDAFHMAGIKVLADIVLNQKMGADRTEEVTAVEEDPDNRNRDVSGQETIEAWTAFDFPGRGNKYSSFKWNHRYFSGTDWDEKTKRHGIFRLDNKPWNRETDPEHGNFDYLLGVDVDTDNQEVREECARWIKWYHDTCKFDGIRFDGVKHISFQFMGEVLKAIRDHADDQKFFAVGEYWHGDVRRLIHYLDVIDYEMSLFDVPLHFRFYDASVQPDDYDLRGILADTLVSERPWQAVTFVDNHDTEPGQSLESFVASWFRLHAYAIILLRLDGMPCVFYGDLYGIPSRNIPPLKGLRELMKIRKLYAYGEQQDYFASPKMVGWIRKGDDNHQNSGLAAVMSSGNGGVLHMEIGRKFAGRKFVDVTGGCTDAVTVSSDGTADFEVAARGVSIWLTAEAAEDLKH